MGIIYNIRIEWPRGIWFDSIKRCTASCFLFPRMEFFSSSDKTEIIIFQKFKIEKLTFLLGIICLFHSTNNVDAISPITNQMVETMNKKKKIIKISSNQLWMLAAKKHYNKISKIIDKSLMIVFFDLIVSRFHTVPNNRYAWEH